METILVATDGSEASTQALSLAIDLATATHSTLEILSVRPRRSGGRMGPGAPMLEVEEFDRTEQIARAAAERASAAGVDARSHAAHGDVVACIVDAIERFDADLLVIGSRGLGAVSGAMLGSVSQALVRRSPVPVTVVRHAKAQAPAMVART
jgi:nucleotide-binding universal stress UspA family protein